MNLKLVEQREQWLDDLVYVQPLNVGPVVLYEDDPFIVTNEKIITMLI